MPDLFHCPKTELTPFLLSCSSAVSWGTGAWILTDHYETCCGGQHQREVQEALRKITLPPPPFSAQPWLYIIPLALSPAAGSKSKGGCHQRQGQTDAQLCPFFSSRHRELGSWDTCSSLGSRELAAAIFRHVPCLSRNKTPNFLGVTR